MNSQIHIVGMQASSKPVEDQIRKLFEHRESFKASMSKEVLDILKKDKGYLVWMYEKFKFYPNQKWLKLEIATLLNLS